MKKISLYLSLFLFGAAVAYGQKPFEGTVTYTYEVTGQNAEMMASMMPNKMIVKYSQEGMVTEMEGGMMAGMMGRIVVNSKKDEAFVVKEAEKAVYVMKPEDMKDAEQPDLSKNITETEETMEILGYTARKYKLDVHQGGMQTQQLLWLTDKLQAPEIKAPSFQQMGGNLMAGGQLPGFPLRVEISIPQTQATIIMTATDLNFDKVAPAEFEKPAGFTEKDFSQMMQMGNR